MKALPALVAIGAIAFGLAVRSPAGLTAPAKARPGADLAVALTDAPDPVGVGKTVTYTITVKNAGPGRATGVAVTAVLPTGLELESASNPCASVGSSVVCKLGTIRKRSKSMVRVIAKATTPGSLSPSAKVTAKTADPHRRNNSASQTTKIAGLDSVKGAGVRPAFQTPTLAVTVEVDAISAFNGEDASGTFATRYGQSALILRGRVVCLTIAGNRAMVGGVVETSNTPVNPVGSGVLLAFTDNGEPGAGRDTEVSYLGIEDPRTCALGDPTREIALTEGNFIVHDEQP
jgi:uncharacterized repeat protein (TIGR01451 family)